MMGHLGKSVEFWEKALALHVEFKALGGVKKGRELVQGLQAAKDRDSGKEAIIASARAEKQAQVEESEEIIVEGAEVPTIDDTNDEKE